MPKEVHEVVEARAEARVLAFLILETRLEMRAGIPPNAGAVALGQGRRVAEIEAGILLIEDEDLRDNAPAG